MLKDAVEEAVGEVVSKTFPFSHTKASLSLSLSLRQAALSSLASQTFICGQKMKGYVESRRVSEQKLRRLLPSIAAIAHHARQTSSYKC